MIDLTVIIVSWNTKDLLMNCLNSLLNDVHNHQMEIFVVDNGSSDGTHDSVRDQFPSVKLIHNTYNAGFAKACNQALSKSKGRYKLLLNPDTFTQDSVFDSLIQFMDQDPGIGISGVQLLNADGSLQNTISNTPTLLTELFNKTVLRWFFPKRFPGKEALPESPIEVESLVGACLMVRAEMLEKVGLFDEAFFLFYEETDLCLRAWKHGWKVVFHPGLTLRHLQGQSVAQRLSRARIEYWHSRYIFFKKHYGRASCLFLSVILLTKLIVNAFLISFLAIFSKKWRGRLKIYGKILNWHLKGLPDDGGLRSLKAKISHHITPPEEGQR